MLRATHLASVLAVLATLLATPPVALAESERAGIVTALQGHATVASTATPAPAPLKFKDHVFVHDRIRTGDHSIVRILLSGRATVTVRERSVLTVIEYPTASQIHVGTGRASIAAVKSRMKPGETIDIVMPNALATIRGTVVVAEVSPAGSTITVIRGLVDVTPLDPIARRPIGGMFRLAALERVTIPNAGTPQAQTLTPAEAEQLGSQFKVGPRETPAGMYSSLTDAQVRFTARHLTDMTGGSPVGAPRGDGSRAAAASATDSTAAPTASSVTAPVVTTTANALAPAVAGAVSTTMSDVAPVVTGTIAPVVTTAANAVAPVVTAVTSVVAPVVTNTVAPVVTAVTSVIAPVVTTVAPVMTAVTPVVAPVVTTVTPVVTAVTPVVAPVVTAVTPVVAPVVTTVAPVVAPVVTAVAPALAPVAPITTAVTTVAPVVAPLTQPASVPSAPTPAAPSSPGSTTQGLLGTVGTLTQGLFGK
ncbi:MAG: FecR domain-containing protein [Candidatus Rokuibacteriota bacterium]